MHSISDDRHDRLKIVEHHGSGLATPHRANRAGYRLQRHFAVCAYHCGHQGSKNADKQEMACACPPFIVEPKGCG